MDKTPKRPVVGSRTPASTPRRVAGRGSRPINQQSNQQPSDEPSDEPSEQPEPARDELLPPEPPGQMDSPRVTVVLAAVLGALVLLGGLLATYVATPDSSRWPWASDAGAESCTPLQPGKEYAVPREPIAVPFVEWRRANEEAAELVVRVLTKNWETYDEQAEEAQEFLTDNFRDEYAATVTDARDRFLESKADYSFAVVGQSVVQACPDRVTSLLFLNQAVYKGEGEARTGPDVYQVRVVATTVREGSTWRIDALDAQ